MVSMVSGTLSVRVLCVMQVMACAWVVGAYRVKARVLFRKGKENGQ